VATSVTRGIDFFIEYSIGKGKRPNRAWPRR
jgi:hypothetical protein